MSGSSNDGEYASPARSMHELTPDFRIASPAGDRWDWSDVAPWRKAERQRLIEARLAMGIDERKQKSERIATHAEHVIGDLGSRIISFYWPFRGEPDLRDWMTRILDRGGRVALPVVIEKGQPLQFRLWSTGEPLERGVWNILVPAHGAVVHPDIVIAPVVGYDAGKYRLGYGGGFFDRTLAAAPNRPLVIGVGYSIAEIATIHPQPHDIPMDVIVTDAGA
ncbi:MAG: putative 5-formyltetrahydrofolate cyclo-ligase [Rhizobium sp.]|nr:putative 5-formyltetrahydrofolate cyclo-ligase [Rhizobium sp.]